jgi:hypothetical protein
MNQMPDDGFDEVESGVDACLVCHIEMDTKGGKSPRDAARRTAETLRKLATAIEAGAFDTGFVPILGVDGEKVGELYLDFYGEG